MSDYPMLISNKLHSFRNFLLQTYKKESTLGKNLSFFENDERIIFYLCPAKEKLNLHFTQYLKNYLIYEIS